MKKKADILKGLLIPFSVLYWCITALRNLLFDFGWFRSVKFPIPVISVGNITVGGTGKTPHIELLLRKLMQENIAVAVLSRGYKRQSKGFVLCTHETDVTQVGDEPMQIAKKFPQSAVAVCENRVNGISQIRSQLPQTECILLDDAFQHRWVTPSLSILLVDYNRPIWDDHVFPAGMMREGFYASKRADIVVVSKCPSDLSLSDAERCRHNLRVSDSVPVYFSSVRYGSSFIALQSGEAVPVQQSNAVVLTGIAQHEAYVNHLRNHFSIAGEFHFSDHHYFTDDELGRVFSFASENKAVVVTTEKDASRLKNRDILLDFPMVDVFFLPIEPYLHFDKESEFTQLVLNHLNTFAS